MATEIALPTPANIARAVDILRAGGLVAIPTETVYGLACDASNGAAVARLYAAKGRPSFNPLIAHVSSGEMATREAVFRADAFQLSATFWPGPLTLVLPIKVDTGTVCDLARAGLPTLALRQPDHPVAAAVISAFGGPIVAPSANPSGRISPVTAQHVAADMDGKIDLILDGGPCRVGLESTIVSVAGARPTLLRPGGLAASEIEAALQSPLATSTDDADAPTSPGQLLRHYAPRAALRLNAEAPRAGEAYLGFGNGAAFANLSPTGDLNEAAANLFTMLRTLDAAHDHIAVAPIPMTGLGAAINDRLTRAAKRD